MSSQKFRIPETCFASAWPGAAGYAAVVQPFSSLNALRDSSRLHIITIKMRSNIEGLESGPQKYGIEIDFSKKKAKQVWASYSPKVGKV